MILSHVEIREIDAAAKVDFLSAIETNGIHQVTIVCCRVGHEEDAFDDSVYGARCNLCFTPIFHRPWVLANVVKICTPCHIRAIESN